MGGFSASLYCYCLHVAILLSLVGYLPQTLFGYGMSMHLILPMVFEIASSHEVSAT